jgi:hypothetical protein
MMVEEAKPPKPFVSNHSLESACFRFWHSDRSKTVRTMDLDGNLYTPPAAPQRRIQPLCYSPEK